MALLPLLVSLMCLICQSTGLDNGLARKPPMGWLSWERFRCVTDCEKYPDSCISEKLFMRMADSLSEDGWLAAGYELVNIDDCWSSKSRDIHKKLQPDPNRFPNGIPALAKYVHDKGLKLGIYGDYGTETCGGYPGSMGHEEDDAETFASWGVDMLKFDGCYSNSTQQAVGYPLMGQKLNATGRPIIYSCSWPAYQGGLPPKVNYTELGEICNLWRNYGDIQDSFEDVVDIINWWGDHQDVLIPAAGPGMWNDPDMLIGGNFGLSYDETKLQFGMWAMLAAPLFLSADLQSIAPNIKDLLQSKEIINIDQDPLGIQGRRVRTDDKIQLWVRPLVGEQQAIAVMSTRTDGVPYTYSFTLRELGIKKPASKYVVMDIFKKDEKELRLDDVIEVSVDPSGIVMLKAIPFTLLREEYVEVEFDIL